MHTIKYNAYDDDLFINIVYDLKREKIKKTSLTSKTSAATCTYSIRIIIHNASAAA